jgi:hypothetical protein
MGWLMDIEKLLNQKIRISDISKSLIFELLQHKKDFNSGKIGVDVLENNLKIIKSILVSIKTYIDSINFEKTITSK